LPGEDCSGSDQSSSEEFQGCYFSSSCNCVVVLSYITREKCRGASAVLVLVGACTEVKSCIVAHANECRPFFQAKVRYYEMWGIGLLGGGIVFCWRFYSCTHTFTYTQW